MVRTRSEGPLEDQYENQSPSKSKSAKPDAKSVKNAETAGTLSLSTQKSKKQNPRDARKLLELNGLLIDDSEGSNSKKGSAVITRALALIQDQRYSPKNEARINKFVKARKAEQFSNEKTFIDAIWKIIVRSKRTVKQKAKDQDEEDETVLVKYWDLDGLRRQSDQPFARGTVPLVDTSDDPDLEALLEKKPGIPNPVPDLAYGLDEDSFSAKENLTNQYLEMIAALSPGMYHTFFVLEFKGYQGTIVDAENQACRGGAAIVQATRTMEVEAGLVIGNNEYNDGSFAFSLAMDPNDAKLYVHWAEYSQSPKIIYHMQMLDSFCLKLPPQVDRLRVTLNNVLDWGVLQRQAYIKTLLSPIQDKLVKTSAGKTPKKNSNSKGKGKATGADSENDGN